jgi:hypothetical protein
MIPRLLCVAFVPIVPLTEGDSLGAERQAGGQAGPNVSSRAEAGRNTARARPPARAALALSPFARGTIPRPMFLCFGQLCSVRGTQPNSHSLHTLAFVTPLVYIHGVFNQRRRKQNCEKHHQPALVQRGVYRRRSWKFAAW